MGDPYTGYIILMKMPSFLSIYMVVSHISAHDYLPKMIWIDADGLPLPQMTNGNPTLTILNMMNKRWYDTIRLMIRDMSTSINMEIP
jgi:hypothetical protein